MSRPLAVGVVCFPSLGGSSVVATELAVGLASRGHRVHLLARGLPARALSSPDGLSFHAVELADYPLFDHPPYTFALASAIIDVARAHPLDLLHVNYAVPHALSAYVARQALGSNAPRVVTALHGTDVLRVGSHPAYKSATRFTVMSSDGITAPSAWLREQAYRLLDLPERAEVEVLPNFVDTDRFSPAEGDDRSVVDALFGPEAKGGPVLFHVSNFRPIKRVRDVIEVLARVRREVPARLVVVGDGPDRAATEERVRELGLERWVRFLGKRREFVEYLRLADAFLLPSETESFGVAALEALSAGVPVFAYRVGGLPELVTAEVGRLVEPFDVTALGRAVLEVLGHEALHAQIARAARRRAVEHYGDAAALDRYEIYLRRIVELA